MGAGDVGEEEEEKAAFAQGPALITLLEPLPDRNAPEAHSSCHSTPLD